MSIEATSWALHQHAPTATAKLVLIGLASHAHADGSGAWPSWDTLATYADTTRRTVSRSLKALEDAGLISRSEWQPEHIRADRRPVAYDLPITGRQNVTPSADDPPRGDRSDTDEVTPEAPRGDLGVTQTVLEPSSEPSEDQTPPSTDVDKPDDLGFEEAWDAYPRRNGKRVGKAEARAKWVKYSLDDRRAIYTAIRNYAAACNRGDTIPRDMHRFLAPTNSYWRDWLEGGGVASSSRGVRSGRPTVAAPEGGWRTGEF